MALEALTLAIASPVHLITGLYGAGIAEGLICVALLTGLVRQRAAMGALCVAVFGFVLGLTFTARGGGAIDLAYHAVMLPVLVATALLLARAQGWTGGAQGAA